MNDHQLFYRRRTRLTDPFSDARKQARGSYREVDSDKWLRDIGKPTLDALQRQLSSIGLKTTTLKDGGEYVLTYEAADLSAVYRIQTLSNNKKFEHNDKWLSDSAELNEDVGTNIGFLEKWYGVKLKS